MALSQWSPYQVPQSLWAVIELYAPTVELSEIKHIIGEDLIEQSNELFEEIYLLLDIWQSEAEQPAPIKRQESLPESPFLREQFINRIQQFINNLDATKNHLLQSFLNERKEVYEYATQKRPSTSDSSSGRLTPSRRSTSRKSTSSTDLSVYRDNMSAFEIDKIVTDIRAAFRDEHRVLKEDIEFLHGAIHDQHSEKTDGSREEPTLNDLKLFADDLEKKVIDLAQPVFANLKLEKPRSPVLKALPRRNLEEPAKVKEDFKKLPSLPSGTKQLSWRQRTLKKVNMASKPATFLSDLELRGGSPSPTTKETVLLPKPPPPRAAFQQRAGLSKPN